MRFFSSLRSCNTFSCEWEIRNEMTKLEAKKCHHHSPQTPDHTNWTSLFSSNKLQKSSFGVFLSLCVCVCVCVLAFLVKQQIPFIYFLILINEIRIPHLTEWAIALKLSHSNERTQPQYNGINWPIQYKKMRTIHRNMKLAILLCLLCWMAVRG